MRARTPLRLFYGLLTVLLWMFTLGLLLFYTLMPLIGQVNEYQVVLGIGHQAILPALSREETAQLYPTPFTGDERPYFDEGRVTLRHETDELPWSTIFFYSSLLYIVPLWFSIVLVRRVLRTVLDGRPFAVENASRLQWLGGITVALTFLGPSYTYYAGKIVLSQLPRDGIPLTPLFDLNLDLLMGGFFLLVLATVFRHGAELEAERELTV